MDRRFCRAALPLLLFHLGHPALAQNTQPAAAAGSGPVIELPPELTADPAPASPAPPSPSGPVLAAPGDQESAPLQSQYFVGDQPQRTINSALFQLPRQFQIDVSLDPRTAGHRGAAVGGYGELTLNAPIDKSGPAVADLRRTILFFGMNFTDRIRYFSEIEWEHAFTSSGNRGEIAVEQMILDFMVKRWFNVRAGMSMIPLGLINLYHEPSTFHGVERPDVDTFIIPTTWKQLLVGFYGAVAGLRYQVYLTPGLLGEGFTAQSGIRSGVQENLPKLHDIGISGRIDWSPILGMNLGLSGYFAKAGAGDPSLGDLSVSIGSLDGRFGRAGVQLRGQLSYVYISHVEQLNAVLLRINPAAGPVARQLLGGYLEVAYDLLRAARIQSGMQLVAFFRYDHTNTQLDVAASSLSGPRQPGCDRTAYVSGLTFKPIFEIAVKADYTYRHSEVANSPSQQIDFALAYQF